MLDFTLTCIQSLPLLSKGWKSYCVFILQNFEKMAPFNERYLLLLMYFSTFLAWSDESSNTGYSRVHGRTSFEGIHVLDHTCLYRVLSTVLSYSCLPTEKIKPHVKITPLKGSAFLQELFLLWSGFYIRINLPTLFFLCTKLCANNVNFVQNNVHFGQRTTTTLYE